MALFYYEIALFPNNYPIGDSDMKNEQFINVLRQLKKEGVTFKAIANASNIPIDKFYHYLNYNKFPYEVRKKIEDTVLIKYKELYNYE